MPFCWSEGKRVPGGSVVIKLGWQAMKNICNIKEAEA